MNINGNVTAVWLPEWANVVLSGSELSDFITAHRNQEALMANAISAGTMSITQTYMWVANSEIVTGNVSLIGQHLNLNNYYWTANNEIKTGPAFGEEFQSLVSNREIAQTTIDYYVKNSTVINSTQVVYNVAPESIPQDSQWLYYHGKFVNDTANVTFPSNWATVTNT